MRSCVLALALGGNFDDWTVEHGKSYADAVAHAKAERTFEANEKVIASLNADPDDSAEYGHTRFSDMTAEEFRTKVLGSRERVGDTKIPTVTVGNSTPPASFDWRDHGAVTPVKDQSSCGSCWAVSAVENVESITHLAGAGLVQLSVEEVVECDPYGDGCYGGFPSAAFKYVLQAGGLAADADYPYNVDGKTICLANQTFNQTCGDGMCDDPPLTSYCDVTCSAKKRARSPKSAITGQVKLPEDEVQLAAWLAQHGPPSVALDATGNGAIGILFPWLQFYKKGVASPKCTTTSLDHAVHLVGFGTDQKDYWLVKNSWGAKWGEDGYFRLERGAGKCGINTLATSSQVQQESVVV